MSPRGILVILGSVREGRNAVRVGRLIKKGLEAKEMKAAIVGTEKGLDGSFSIQLFDCLINLRSR